MVAKFGPQDKLWMGPFLPWQVLEKVGAHAKRLPGLMQNTPHKTGSRQKSRYYAAFLECKHSRVALFQGLQQFCSSVYILQAHCIKNGSIVSGFPSTICLMFSYVIRISDAVNGSLSYHYALFLFGHSTGSKQVWERFNICYAAIVQTTTIAGLFCLLSPVVL